MNRIKQLSNNKIKLEHKKADGSTMWLPYKPYILNDIPKNFGCVEFADEVEGIPEWFNHKGFTYVLDK